MHDDRKLVEDRITRYLSHVLQPALHPERTALTVSAWHVPGEPVPVAEALAVPQGQYRPFAIGEAWGGPWSTTWFRFSGTVPAAWAGRRVEAVFDLGFDPGRGPGGQAEGLVHTPDGRALHGLHPMNRDVLVSTSAEAGASVEFLVEAAANPGIESAHGRDTHFGDRATAGEDPLYRLVSADLAVRDDEVWHLIHDVEVLDQLMRELPLDSPRRHEIMRALARAADATDPRDVSGTASAARGELVEALTRPAYTSAHKISGVGHAHIDSAWLWPQRETMRKCVRTFSNVLSLAEEYPELIFACSSAQQYAWVKQSRPELFERIRKAVGEGTFVPVGGMWVEADGNMPGGEALARQLVYGRRFFAEEFGIEQDGVWLPDSFGYTAAYPQLARLAGAEWFLSQKLHWSETNELPHHTFAWEGIDGTRILTHFPPIDSYNAELTGRELAHAQSNFRDKGDATMSLAPFGHGDGGGGPTREMLEKARRLRDLEGSPRVEVQNPSQFFQEAAADYPNPPVWRGELYLEYHRGVYTSQARTKRGNRRSEALLREAELWSATAAVRTGATYPHEELDDLWQQVLLHQFHDILPGTSIAWVHREAEAVYGRIHERLEAVIAQAADALAEDAGRGAGSDGDDAASSISVLNAAAHDRREVVLLATATTTAPAAEAAHQVLSDGRVAALADVPALGIGSLLPELADLAPVTVTADSGGGFVLANGVIEAHIDADGLLRSVRDLALGRDAIAPGGAGNLLQLHRDQPNLWPAWNLERHYRTVRTDLTAEHGAPATVTLLDAGPLVATVRVERTFGDSRLVQDVRLGVGSRRLDVVTDIDWRERDAVLKSAWQLDVHAEHTAAEIQFGHVSRPTHENTSWDAARFEVWAHRWIHVGEHGWGTALITDSTYGYDASRLTRPEGGSTTTVRLTLLRAPNSPDPQADLGRHRFAYAVVPGADTRAALAEAHALNLPLRATAAGGSGQSLVTVDNPDVVVECVKLADDRSGDIVVRLYESRSGRAETRLGFGFPVAEASITDLLERPDTPLTIDADAVDLTLRPFQILTLRLTPGSSDG
ncbi:glycoside hydrolase family 38 [Catenulispora acidiphila DSM 44928]|uniref:Glycoside hydrolase family 38 n=1 Tax=Catenulispora acidiphila (strain DSM 44928 / JCM 14897 / NBRC 102108 / NRRL B-24433 / ID139908) TaxID=479433 RepID=C7QBD9_CATAD|nr:glycoside hydrolase family 38 C-terminal domain-containing protein [Catenulispora acidiphila]ACU70516.1 glycoside hydrolase family 38 [Catenulispora acidiphila DSM 44928]